MNKILFVDDEMAQLDMLAESFAGKYETVKASNGKNALKIIEEDHVDIIVSDIQMPKMNGLKLAKKTTALKPNIPVVLMTGYGTVEIAVDAMKNGASDFLLKPVELGYLEQVIVKNLERVQDEKEEFQLAQHFTGNIRCSVSASDFDTVNPLARYLTKMIFQHGFLNASKKNAIGTCMYEALSNALFHGALGVPSEGLREDDSGDTAFMDEVRRRALSSTYASEKIEINLNFCEEQLEIVINDFGKGFDWKKNMEGLENPEHLLRNYGRGLMIISGLMKNNFSFNDQGNTLTLVFKRTII